MKKLLQSASPQGYEYEFRLCRVCCKDSTDRDCLCHGILIKSRRAKAKQFEAHSTQPAPPTAAAQDPL